MGVLGCWRWRGSRSLPGVVPAEPSPACCRRDLEDMRLEMCQERAKRQALQVSPWRGAAPVSGSPSPPPTLTAFPHRRRSSG